MGMNEFAVFEYAEKSCWVRKCWSNALGSCYQGTEINESKAFEWYKKAADLGNPFAMNLVADCYEKGFTQVEALLEKAYLALIYK